jgi:hypothetical protein
MHLRGMTRTIQSGKKPRQMLIVGAILLLMAAIIYFLYSHTTTTNTLGPGNFLALISKGNSTWLSSGANITGTGDTKSETRNLALYSTVEGDGSIDIKWSPGNLPAAVVEAQENILPHIKTEVVGGTLKIYSDASISTTGALTVTLVGPQLNRVEMSGSGDFTATSVEGDSLDVTVSGSSDLHFDGSVHQFKVNISGSGDVDASDLKTESTEVTIAGSGDVDVNATDSLSAGIYGSGSVTYRGKPAHLTQNIAGSGSIQPK